MSDRFTDIVSLLTCKGLPFALYRLPGQQPVLVAQQTRSLEKYPIEALDKMKGFVVAPFTAQKQMEFIRPDIVFKEGRIAENLQKELQNLPRFQEVVPQKLSVQTRQEYLKSVDGIIKRLREGELKKLVFSRVKRVETGNPDRTRLFAGLEKKYPSAFVYLLYLPDRGCWVGATPEILFSISGETAETVALAGTLPAGRPGWTDKEREEQEMVTAYIEEALWREGVESFEKQGPETVPAGQLLHLKTTFSIPMGELKHPGRLVARLHPTPAVCGLPADKAFQLIGKIEKHQRSLYTGFLGPWNLDGASRLFVNLRCARLEVGFAHIFVGGGITAASDPQSEWEETENKSQTLLSVLKKL